MVWLLLGGAIVAEVIATSLLKFTEGFTRLWPTLVCLLLYGIAFLFLAQSTAHGMQVGIAYALWSAIGTTAIVAVGVAFLGEPISMIKIIGVALVVAGVVILNIAAS
ncbi:DMT family transporter [Mycolicibacterium gilvum]|uniref:DMT family transporter n=1 Tax=Mycolicibacterium gilvum TaxID=1804 RepID=UPI000E1BC667|nr:multidrug efflux SMR transporter [Mycolicibacterium gilvum]MCV7054324.1 multidrug efflux SMR transporter [Mycolicibacterium gilvum]